MNDTRVYNSVYILCKLLLEKFMNGQQNIKIVTVCFMPFPIIWCISIIIIIDAPAVDVNTCHDPFTMVEAVVFYIANNFMIR